MKFLKAHNEGQTLIEILFAIGIVILVLVAVVGATIVSLRNSSFAKMKSRAASLVQEGMEEVRTSRDRATSWENFISNGPWGAGEVDAEGFTRSISIINPYPPGEPDSYKALITVTVSWQDSKGTHQFSSQTILSSWRQ